VLHMQLLTYMEQFVGLQCDLYVVGWHMFFV